MPRFPALLLCLVATLASAQPKLELRDGDSVLLIGDTLIEREGNYGRLEMKMRREFPGRSFTVRNLGFSADTPLGASRASFDPVARGLESLKEQLAVVKPTVAIIGYGMAASLEDLTYRHDDPSLNPDPARYGLDHGPEKFRRDLKELLTHIRAAAPGGNARFVFLGPVEHEDLRASRPGLPDPAENRANLRRFEQVVREVAAETGSPFVVGEWKKSAGIPLATGTDNGIHLGDRGYRALAEGFAAQLGWKVDREGWDTADAAEERLHEAVLRKNSLFFHRSRPANYTYIFGFRKREQGQNAVEIPKFDPLIDQAEADIRAITLGQAPKFVSPPKETPKVTAITPLPTPDFQVSKGLKLSLFAENPLLEKPVHMNWDSSGRLWVATSNTYPQVSPEDLAAHLSGGSAAHGPSTGDDKLILIEDNDRDGVADVSRVVADGLLIPSGVAPDNFGGAYVGASTELLHLGKPSKDGLLSERRIVLSGFGTEDTHHIIHTLHWGLDGRLYFHQTIYIHSHVETPWGVVRANSGVAFAYDPARERLEVYSKGLVNAWGQQEDLAGQTFLTSGADGTGVHWAFPGATFPPSEGARRLVGSISPGSYPKFCGLEIVNSPVFGADWQGNAITNDFRAHRIVRFGFTDFSVGDNSLSGYETKQLDDLVRTSDVAFRPIALKMGPDGALYVGDWTNPIINHGEVDFRDPRRDKYRGRIWRIIPEGAKGLDWKPVLGRDLPALLAALLSLNRWEFEQARRELAKVPVDALKPALLAWATDDAKRRHAAWLLSGRSPDAGLLESLLSSSDPASVQVGLRELGKAPEAAASRLASFLSHRNARVRVEAVRALSRVRTPESAEAAIRAVTRPEDSFLDFSAWLTVNELAAVWLADATAKGIEGKEPLLERVVAVSDPTVTAPYVQKLFAGRNIDRDGTGPWIELFGKAGAAREVDALRDVLFGEKMHSAEARRRAAAALVEAARNRNLRPSGDLSAVGQVMNSGDRELLLLAVRLIGQWKQAKFLPDLGALAGREDDGVVREAAFDAIRTVGTPACLPIIRSLASEERPIAVRRGALVSQAVHAPGEALKNLPGVFKLTPDENQAAQLWRQMFTHAPFAQRIAKDFPKGLSVETYRAALQAASGLGRSGQPIVKAVQPLVGAKSSGQNQAEEIAAMVQRIKLGADPADGELIYRRAGCSVCHAIGGAGGKLGPDMSSLGASAPLDYIIESLLNPAAKVKEGYHAFSFSMKDGSQMVGIPARESATEIFIRPGPGVELPVLKSAVVRRENVGSIMPAGLIDGLNGTQKRNLIAFLSEIGKPGPFDASKADVARLWLFLDQPPGALAKSGAATPVPSLISGRVPKDFNPGRIYASARFTNARPTAAPLQLTGIKAAWLGDRPLRIRDGKVAESIPAGEHVLTVEPDPNAPFFRAQCDDVTFLGD